jgi:hypothetical protein
VVGQSALRHISRTLLDRRLQTQHDLDPVLEEQKRTKELLGHVLVKMGILRAEGAGVPLSVQGLDITADAVKIAAGERHLLGALLVQSGHITSKQLDQAIAEQQRSGEKLGEVFQRSGMLTERQLRALLDFQLNQELAHASPLRLGELLVATGHISRQQLEDALHLQALSHNKLGEILVEAGYVRPSRIKYGIRLQKMLLNAVLAAVLSLEVSTVSRANPLPDAPSQAIMKSALEESGEFSCLSEKESELFRLVNEYRESRGLPPIANSRSLNKVARIHAIDLVMNSPATDSRGLDCTLHSWSDQGAWKPVCYTKDNSSAEAMWDKPREITNLTYTGDGYENAYSSSEKEVTPAKVLDAWKSSPSHNAILLESGVWEGSNLLAFGVGIHKNHAVIWVGSLNDPLGPMQACLAAKN